MLNSNTALFLCWSSVNQIDSQSSVSSLSSFLSASSMKTFIILTTTSTSSLFVEKTLVTTRVLVIVSHLFTIWSTVSSSFSHNLQKESPSSYWYQRNDFKSNVPQRNAKSNRASAGGRYAK